MKTVYIGKQDMDCIISKSQKAPVIDEDTINAGEATSTNQPAILRVDKVQQRDANQEPKSKGSLFHLIDNISGVSVHYLRNILLQDAALNEDTATIYDIEDLNSPKQGINCSKGAQTRGRLCGLHSRRGLCCGQKCDAQLLLELPY